MSRGLLTRAKNSSSNRLRTSSGGINQSTITPLTSSSSNTSLDSVQVASIPRLSSGDLRNWAEVAKASSSSVVKILAQVVEFDWGQPYRRSADGESVGSGFFVEGGLILTNAHVVESAQRIWITLPREGERRFTAKVVGVCFDVDLALLRPAVDIPETKCLEFGVSDEVSFGEEVMTLGYPLGMNSLKLTVGIVSGRQDALFQTDAPLNPGNSGGPMLNNQGKVIGINVSIVEQSQNVGFAIPCKQFTMLSEEMKARPANQRILHKPILGVDYCNSSDALLEFHNCPVLSDSQPNNENHSNRSVVKRREGIFVSKAFKGFPLYQAGVRDGDILHSFDGCSLDNFGHAQVQWSSGRVTLADLMSLVTYDSKPGIEFSRDGQVMTGTIDFTDPENSAMPMLPEIRFRYPPYERPGFEVFAGLCVMELALNHVEIFGENATSSFVQQLLPIAAAMEKQLKPALIITNVLVGSNVSRLDVLKAGMLLDKVNGIEVSTLEEYRAALAKPIVRGDTKYLYFASKGNDIVALLLEEVLEEEEELADMHIYTISTIVSELKKANPELELPQPAEEELPVLRADSLDSPCVVDFESGESPKLPSEEVQPTPEALKVLNGLMNLSMLGGPAPVMHSPISHDDESEQ